MIPFVATRLKVISRQAALIFRSPRRTLGICIGVLVIITLVALSLTLTPLKDKQEGEELYINEEDYVAVQASQMKSRQSSGEIHSKPTKNGKSVHQLPWQKVAYANDEMYVYSAYYDANFRLIRVMAVANQYVKHKLECRFTNDGSTVIGTTPIKMKSVRENNFFKYSSMYILCSLPLPLAKYHKSSLPRFVSIASTRLSRESSHSNILEIQYPPPEPSVKYSVCVQPTYNNYDNVYRFLEWVEFHRSLGVERFTFYNISIGPSVSCVMREYNNLIARGFGETGVYMEVLPWGYPSKKFESEVTIKQQIQLGALNDCIYRHRGIAQYVFNIDFDEFILPHADNDTNYDDLIRRLRLLSGWKRVGLYKFRDAFFYPNNPIYEFGESIEGLNTPADSHKKKHPEWQAMRKRILSELVTLRDTVRVAEPIDYRTKYFCIPERIVEAGIHHTWQMLKGFGTLNVPANVGILHHYRTFKSVPKTEDDTAKNFSVKHDIPSRVTDVLFALKDVCHI